MAQNFTNFERGDPMQDPESKSPRASDLFYGGYRGGATAAAHDAALKGDDAAQRQAYQTNFTQANDARARDVGDTGLQMGSLATLQGAANGTAPSQAAILANQQTAQAINGGYSMAGAVKGGPGARIAAARNAQRMAATQAAQGAQTAAAARANEMAGARQAYAGQTNAIRGADQATRSADLGAAQLQQQSELQQRQMNQQGEQYYQGLSHQITGQQLDANLQKQSLDQSHWANRQGLEVQNSAQGIGQTTKDVVGIAGAVGSAAGSLASFSDEKTKVPASLDLYGQIDKDTAGAEPYKQDADVTTGVSGAPRGYAASRQGQAGYMFGGAPDVDASVPGLSDDHDKSNAPGTHDWTAYGDPGSSDLHAAMTGGKVSETDWSKKGGGSDKKDASKMGGGLKGVGDSLQKVGTPNNTPVFQQYKPEQVGRTVTVSDDHAKLAAAWDEGHAAATSDATKIAARSPAELKELAKSNQLAQTLSSAKGDAWDEGHRAPPEGSAPPDEPGSVSHMIDVHGIRNRVAAMIRSDERTKTPPSMTDAIDAKQREGKREPKSFQRDDAGDQRAVKRAYEDKAAKDADANIAGMKRSLGQGASVSRYEGEAEDGAPAEWLSNYMHGGEMKAPSEHQLADANRSMDPKVYAYKPTYAAAEGQQPGETNVGPIAQHMAADPVARTAIVKDPQTGMLGIDKDKGLKLVMGGLAGLQEQLDALKGARK